MDYLVRIIMAVAWPVSILIVVLVFFAKFRSAFDYFLRDIRAIHFPGGMVEAQSASTTNGGTLEGREKASITLSADQAQHLKEYIDTLQLGQDMASKEAAELQTELGQTYRNLFAWKFEYLRLFYVPRTKGVLFWFAGIPAQTRDAYHRIWQIQIPSSGERDTILEVLLRCGMLESDGASLKIIHQGYGFLQYIGMIPQAQSRT